MALTAAELLATSLSSGRASERNGACCCPTDIAPRWRRERLDATTVDTDGSNTEAIAEAKPAGHRAGPAGTRSNRGSAAELGLATRAIHFGLEPCPATGAILTPIVQSTTYVQEAVGQHKGHTYSRASNPTVSALEAVLGGLESAPPAVCYGTGMASITGLFLALLKAGDHVIICDVVYGGTVRLVQQVLEGLGISASFVDCSSPAAVDAAITDRTRLVFIETPGNPTLKLIDVEAVAQVCNRRGVKLAVDNTFLTAAILRPLDLGADISLYSTTKYIEGHNATVGGAIVTRDERLLDRLRLIRKTLGSIQAPFEAWLTIKGIKTLSLRLRKHCESALEVARFLESHPKVSRVSYPGLESNPQFELAQRQHRVEVNPGRFESWHGGIVSFEVVGGVDAAVRVLNSTTLCALAENLGAAETLITHPVTMTHGDVPRDQRLAAGITDGLIRLSVGLEDAADIIADLSQALDSI